MVFGLGNDNSGDYRVLRWDPIKGTSENLLKSPGIWSETVLVGDALYLNRPHEDRRVCIDRAPVADLSRLTTVECAEQGGRINYLRATDEYLTYMVYPDDGECGTVHGISAERAAALKNVGCISRAVADSKVVAWTGAPSETSLGLDFSHAALGALSGGRVYDLGETEVGAAAVCAGAVYWVWHDDDRPIEPAQIRRWRPGSPDVEIIYSSPDEDEVNGFTTSAPTCGGGRVFIQRIGWLGTSKEEFLSAPLE